MEYNTLNISDDVRVV